MLIAREYFSNPRTLIWNSVLLCLGLYFKYGLVHGDGLACLGVAVYCIVSPFFNGSFRPVTDSLTVYASLSGLDQNAVFLGVPLRAHTYILE